MRNPPIQHSTTNTKRLGKTISLVAKRGDVVLKTNEFIKRWKKKGSPFTRRISLATHFKSCTITNNVVSGKPILMEAYETPLTVQKQPNSG